MDKNIFYRQAELLISVLPYIAEDTGFALHGGTAINFFVRDMPRISVDIDLTCLQIGNREESLQEMSNGLNAISERISSHIPSARIEKKSVSSGDYVGKLFVKKDNAVVKIEPNQVIRGNLFDCEEKDICKKAEALFEKFVTVKTLSFDELYGSKICAALDRQHPRDVFDVMLLLQNEGITEKVRKAFIVYLISHNRPISELLSPNFKDIKQVFERELAGMTSVEVKFEELEHIRKTLAGEIIHKLAGKEREFLLSFKEREPRWDLLGVESAKNMPAVKWKLANLAKMSRAKHKEAVNKLKRILE